MVECLWYEREKRDPVLADLRESGAIEQDADIVMFMHEPEEGTSNIEVIIAKNRQGSTGKFMLRFQKQHSRFYALIDRDEQQSH